MSKKTITESLVGKKPATAAKLFAEEMEARLDELSKKTLGRYINKAIVDRDARHFERDYSKRAANQLLQSGHKEKAEEHSARAVASAKKGINRTAGINNAIDKLTKEDLDEVEAPANFWNAGMAKMNPIQVSQKQPAEPGQFKATGQKSPKRLADQDSSLEGAPQAVRKATCDDAASRGPKEIELTGDWQADVPDHDFDPKLDSETEFYPLFSQFKAMGAYPSGPARAWEETDIKAHKAYKKNYKMPEYMKEGELNELSKKTLSKYVDVAADKLAGHAYLAGGGSRLDKEGKTKEFRKAVNRLKGIKLANKKLSEDSASLMATATKDEKKAAEQDKKKPSEFKKLHDKHETEVKAKMKELGEEALDEGLFDPAKQPLLALWDEHARRADAHGSGSRNEILKRIEDHVANKHGQEGLKKMKLHTDLTNALKRSTSNDKGHLQALLGNMRTKCAMEG